MSKQYKILEAATPGELSDKVNMLMEMNIGWRPEGGVNALLSNPPKYTQSMVREVEIINVENRSSNGKQLLHG